MSYILGLSCYFHDSAAVIIHNGEIIAAAQEERFSRKKQDNRFPVNAIKFCLESANIKMSDVDDIAFYENPRLKFKRILLTHLRNAPKGASVFASSMKERLSDAWKVNKKLINDFKEHDLYCNYFPEISYAEHHQSHAASAFYPSPYEEAAVLCLDGVGEIATTSLWLGKQNQLIRKWEIEFPHSLGLLYSAFTQYCGFKVDSGEYKVMGLAPYGQPVYKDLIYKKLINVADDGKFTLNTRYFDYEVGHSMVNEKFEDLFGGPCREPESELTEKEFNLAASIQAVTEEVVLKLVKSIKETTGVNHLCLAGGVALNCVSNGNLVRSEVFDDVWVQPASGDAGCALGAALLLHYQSNRVTRFVNPKDSMKGSYLGTSYTNDEIKEFLESKNANFTFYDEGEIYKKVSQIISEGNVIGWFRGSMEFGPRALGSRSILGDPRNEKMQKNLNLKIKFREAFRPFAPIVLKDEVSKWFNMKGVSPYMLQVTNILEHVKLPISDDKQNLFGIDKLNVKRSSIPAVTHVDYSARIQTVDGDFNKPLHTLLTEFNELTGCPILVNTSFNVRGEPIVESPENAFKCFQRTNMDYLVLGNYVLSKENNESELDDQSWMSEFELD